MLFYTGVKFGYFVLRKEHILKLSDKVELQNKYIYFLPRDSRSRMETDSKETPQFVPPANYCSNVQLNTDEMCGARSACGKMVSVQNDSV